MSIIISCISVFNARGGRWAALERSIWCGEGKGAGGRGGVGADRGWGGRTGEGAEGKGEGAEGKREGAEGKGGGGGR